MNENNPTRAATVMLNGARVLLKFIKDDKEEFKRIQQKRVEMISLALNVMIQIGKKENDGGNDDGGNDDGGNDSGVAPQR
jgi:hypothetical protein